MKTAVIYHRADFDGIFCREIARKFLPEAELIGWHYGDALIPTPVEGDVYILDLSPECLDNQYNPNGLHNVIWIDHHKSAIEKFSSEIQGYRIDGVAACRLAWQWFSVLDKKGFHQIGELVDGVWGKLPEKQQFINRNVSEPLAVRLAGEYDIWDKRDPHSELFQHGLKSRDLSSYDWKMLLSNEVDEILQGTGMEQTDSELACANLLSAGHIIQYAQTQQNESIIKDMGFDLEFEGLKFLACNHARYNSQLFTAGLKPEHDACFGFKWIPKNQCWEISLYHALGKEHHDLSRIAVKHGGGGHRGACGFRLKKLPFV
jgi:uncharacterized protein